MELVLRVSYAAFFGIASWVLLDRGISGEIVVTRFIVYVRIEIEMF